MADLEDKVADLAKKNNVVDMAKEREKRRPKEEPRIDKAEKEKFQKALEKAQSPEEAKAGTSIDGFFSGFRKHLGYALYNAINCTVGAGVAVPTYATFGLGAPLFATAYGLGSWIPAKKAGKIYTPEDFLKKFKCFISR